jgi:hypothetical protein
MRQTIRLAGRRRAPFESCFVVHPLSKKTALDGSQRIQTVPVASRQRRYFNCLCLNSLRRAGFAGPRYWFNPRRSLPNFGLLRRVLRPCRPVSSSAIAFRAAPGARCMYRFVTAMDEWPGAFCVFLPLNPFDVRATFSSNLLRRPGRVHQPLRRLARAPLHPPKLTATEMQGSRGTRAATIRLPGS